MVTIKKLNKCMVEIKRFLAKERDARGALIKGNSICKETAAVKRASMDLTRVLSELRKS